MALSVTIDGVAKNLKRNTLEIAKTANGRSTANFSIVSLDASYRPQLDDPVVVTNGSTTEFAGLIDRVTEKGVVAGARDAIEIEVNCGDYQGYADRRFVNATISAGTLKAALTTLVTYLTDYGVTLDAAQAVGPTLPELTYQYRQLSDILNELATLTASAGEPYVWKISASKVFGMYQASDTAAPFDIVIPSTIPIGDIEVEQVRHDYANRVIVTVPTVTQDGRTESFTGDGTTTTFTLQYTVLRQYGHVLVGSGGGETLGLATDSPRQWTFDPVANTITREIGPSVNGETYTLYFDGSYTGLGTAEDAGEIAAVGLYEKVIQLDSVPTDDTADEIAAGYLATLLSVSQTVRYATLSTGLDTGMTQTITVPQRDIDGTAIISEIRISDFGARDETLRYEITAILDDSQTNVKKGWRDSIKQAWSLSGVGGGSTTVAPVTAAAGGPAAPFTAVQFNDSGAFGGSSEFRFLKDVASLIVGGGGSDITATNVQSCGVLGHNCHIVAP